MSKELSVDTAVVVVPLVLWLVSWLVVFWRRDAKRERVRFARENGRTICPCTESGEITELRHVRGKDGPLGKGQEFDTFVCPKCGAWSAEPVTMIHGGIHAA